MDDPRLVLFDIDGTLLWSDGSGRAAMEIALKRVYGTAGPIDDYYFGGHTDREAVQDLLSAEGIDDNTIWERFDDLSLVLETILSKKLLLLIYPRLLPRMARSRVLFPVLFWIAHLITL